MSQQLQGAMSHLRIFPAPSHTPGEGPGNPDDDLSPLPSLESNDPGTIQAELLERGIRFERWPARQSLPSGADQEAILKAYAHEVAAVQSSGGYGTVDAIRITPEHPDRETLRSKFLNEHTHAEDEVRFFVEGQGLFCLHLGHEVVQVLCCADDWIAVPAGTKHWFDMGSAPSFCAIRFFNNPEGWVAQFTGDPIASRYPLLN